MKSSSTSVLAMCGVTAGAFANEFFGLMDHTLHVPVYRGEVKLFIDAVAVICAGTIATMNSITKGSSLESALLDSSVPIILAYVAPSLFTTSIVHTFRKEEGMLRRRVLPLVFGVIFIAFLSSLEHVLSEFLSQGSKVNNMVVVSILVNVILGLIILRNLVGTSHEHHTNENRKDLFFAILGIIALFGGAMFYNHPSIISHNVHRILATLFGIITLAVAAYGITLNVHDNSHTKQV